MPNQRRKIGDNEHLALFREVDGRCPLCKKSLIYEKKHSYFKAYDVAHIYPLNPTSIEKSLLRNEKLLNDDVNHIDNLILLCKGCHDKFDKPRTVEEYRLLVGVKQKLQGRAQERDIWYEYGLKSEISLVVSKITQLDIPFDNVPLEYDPQTLENKSDPTLTNITKQKIRTQINKYFVYVRDELSGIEASEVIASQIKTYYLELKRKGINQQYIYENLVEWLYDKTGGISSDACEVVISFFVQNCEVFSDEVTK